MEIVKKTLSQKLIKQTIYVLIGSLLLTISAKVKIPFLPNHETFPSLKNSLDAASKAN